MYNTWSILTTQNGYFDNSDRTNLDESETLANSQKVKSRDIKINMEVRQNVYRN